MSGFTLYAETALSPAAAWAALTDWDAHSRLVPLTRVWAHEEQVTARTSLGRVHLDDVMRVEVSEAPDGLRGGRLELTKVGAVHGAARIEVAPLAAGGSKVRWVETVRIGPRWFRRVSGPVQDLVARLAFGRVLRQLLRGAESHAGLDETR